MATTDISTDRRKTPRYRFNGGALAVFKPEPLQLGQVVDIGIGGLSVQVIQKANPSQDYSTMTLLLEFPDRTIDDIPIRTVAEFKVTNAFKDEENMFQRCIAFGPLTPEQQRDLSFLVAEYAGKETEERRRHRDRRSAERREPLETDRRQVPDRRGTESDRS